MGGRGEIYPHYAVCPYNKIILFFFLLINNTQTGDNT